MSAGSGRRSSRHWGWHRLQPEWADRIVAAAGVRPGELVLDLGAGTGALTAPLVRSGARVIAVELHPGRAAALRNRFADPPGVRVAHADLTSFGLPRRPFRVVANPPYSVSATLLRRLLASRSQLYAADLVLPEWAVNRWVAAQPGGRRWSTTTGLWVPSTAFVPSPPVGSAVLRLRLRRRG